MPEAEALPEALIDTHRHLVLRDSLGYAWTDTLPPLAGAFTPGDYDRLTEGAGIAGVLHMETGVDERDWRVTHHLLMSDVAQKRDLTDPRTVRDFAA
ncbi:hypothetical protein CNY89_17430, partial [Amaricoccus sp. HAR-UPW-R2A-40]